MEETIIKLLLDEVPDADPTSKSLVDDGTLDSLAITGLVASLTMEFDIDIPYEEIVEENFNSVAALCALVQKLKD